MPLAYKIPLPLHYRDEFDALDLRGMTQTVVVCPLTCGARPTRSSHGKTKPQK